MAQPDIANPGKYGMLVRDVQLQLDGMLEIGYGVPMRLESS
jgi:hypothetical protein